MIDEPGSDWPSWSVEEHLGLMDAHDIATAVLSISSPGVHFGDDADGRALARHVNDAGRLSATPAPTGSDTSRPCPCPM